MTFGDNEWCSLWYVTFLHIALIIISRPKVVHDWAEALAGAVFKKRH